MWRLSLPSDPKLLEADAARAGLALACSYSSSEEYEAELIRVRREAGVYGTRRPTMAAIAAAMAAAVMVVVLASGLFHAG
jgi:hypothetical protein